MLLGLTIVPHIDIRHRQSRGEARFQYRFDLEERSLDSIVQPVPPFIASPEEPPPAVVASEVFVDCERNSKLETLF